MIKLIKNIKVYDPEDIGIKDILITDGVIYKVEENIEAADYVEVIDGSGLIATPGFIDQHVHLIGGGGEGGFTTRVPEIQLTDLTRGGITTVVGLLGTDVYTRSVENLLAKTKSLNEEGITAYCLTGGYKYPSITLTESVEKDLTFIKEVIGLKLAISDHRSSQVTYEELKRLASQVRLSSMMSGKKGYIHLHLGRDDESIDLLFKLIENTSLPIAMFRPTHVHKIIDDAIKFAKLGGMIDFTVSLRESSINELLEAIRSCPKDSITISSDGNGSMPKWNEKNEMIGMGVSSTLNILRLVKHLINDQHHPPQDILRLCTINTAKSIGHYPRKGCIKEHSDADINIFTEDFTLKHVMAKGKWMIKDHEIVKYGTFERSNHE
ncbi:beta-aspartyl-peptidase [Acidaminobacter sp. JC074]|uniref:beta-aspartyl-peptidase n=1 Tax=Acidaminobacter sp. JC074 TaxID=2530199 RepID=UPI001F102C7A|nr:beta-aspartyl-peptidase [Acidaminobacter sp. JC074]MCH4886334.1 beta-aspartyl-peptidase [Acidaminobacter sp. JC074]